jgi:hypothetical protein
MQPNNTAVSFTDTLFLYTFSSYLEILILQ